MGSPYIELKREAWEANLALVRAGLVIQTFGNVSALDRGKGVLAIKPSGVPYGRLKPEDMVVVDLENRIVEGKLRPSSDTRTHTVLYRSFEKIGGVAHTHSTYATAWAQTTRPIPVLGTTHADIMAAPVPCTRVMSDTMIQGDYEEQTGLQILEAFETRSPQEIPMVLVACHGPFTWGETAAQAVTHSEILEAIARMAFITLTINPETPPLKRTLLDKHFQRKHGKNAYYGQES